MIRSAMVRMSSVFAIIADNGQAEFCDYSRCDYRREMHEGRMTPDEIKAELRARGMSQRDLAEAVDMDENHLSKSLAGRRKFTVKEMDAIRVVLAPEPGDEAKIPVRSIPLLGKVPAGKYSAAEQTGGRRWIVPDPNIPARAYALTVEGDSMDLLIANGGVIVIDPDDTALWPEECYVVQTEDGESTFKEFQAEPARLVPCSSNPAHKEILLGQEPIKIVGRVILFTTRKPPRRARRDV